MDEFGKLLGQIYDAALGQEDWSTPLSMLADYCRAANAALVMSDESLDFASVVTPRADPSVVNAFNTYWWRHDPSANAAYNMPLGRIVTLNDIGREEFLGSAFYNDFWRYSGLGAERASVNLARGPGAFACCVLQASALRDELDFESAARFVAIAPHLIRSVDLQRRLRRIAMEAAISDVLAQEKEGTAIMLVDRTGRLLSANSAAEDALRRADILSVRQGRLKAVERTAQPAIEAIGSSNTPSLSKMHRRSFAISEVHAEIEVVPFASALNISDVTSPAPSMVVVLRNSSGTGPNSNVERRRNKLDFTEIAKDIRRNLTDPNLSLNWMAERHETTSRALRNLFYARNDSFTQWVLAARLDLAKEMLSEPQYDHMNVASIALESGFGDISWFQTVFRRRFGMTPGQIRLARRTEP